jgi:hypothetical protein
MNRVSAVILAAALVASIGAQHATAQKLLMLKDGPRGSAKVGSQCNGPMECSPANCQRCTQFSVSLPRNAQVQRIECWGTKTLPGPKASWLEHPNKSVQYARCETSYEYSDFTDVRQQGNVVTGTFRNWASGIDRYAEIRVYYTLP